MSPRRIGSRRVGTAVLLATLSLGASLPAAGSINAGAATAKAANTTFDDEFDGPAGSAPNSALWSVQTSGALFKHQSLANYTNSPANVSLDGKGHLNISVQRLTSGSSVTYTSGFVVSKGLVGPDMHIEARIKMAGGYGMWPLFWIEGLSSKGVGWPANGEIDVAENPAKLPTLLWATAHGLAVGNSGTRQVDHWKTTTVVPTPHPLANAYHVYALDVTPTSLVWSFDGKVYKVFNKTDLQPTWVWSFNMPFAIMLNVDVGGPFPGNPKPTTKFPSTMSIDYVRVSS